MAPIKFEEDMRDRLEKRTINPSSKSWDILSERIDNKEKKDNTKGFWWLGMAASVVGILLVSNSLLNSKTTKNTNSIIVEQNKIIDTLKTEVQKLIIVAPEQEEVVYRDNKPVKKSSNIKDNKTSKNTKYYTNNTSITSKKIINKVQIKDPKLIDKSSILNEPLVVIAKTITDKKTIIEPKKTIIIDNEINTLLAKATEDIAMQKQKNNSIPIDYNGLLISVEDDLEETFRDKMFKAVKKGYSTVIESVADRNE